MQSLDPAFAGRPSVRPFGNSAGSLGYWPSGTPSAGRRMYCPRCQGERSPRADSRGSPLTTLVLLFLCFPAAIAYELWRRAGKYVCPACGKGGMVDSRRTHSIGGSAKPERPNPPHRQVRTVLRTRSTRHADVAHGKRAETRESGRTLERDAAGAAEAWSAGNPDATSTPRPGVEEATSQANDVNEADAAKGPVTGNPAQTTHKDLTADPPIDAVRLISVPGPQATERDTPVVFSAATGNPISVGDVSAARTSGKLIVALRARRGSVRLSPAPGLEFTLGNGRDNFVIHFSGSAKAVNAALEGLSFTPSGGFVGNAFLWVGVDEPAAAPAPSGAAVVIAVGELEPTRPERSEATAEEKSREVAKCAKTDAKKREKKSAMEET